MTLRFDMAAPYENSIDAKFKRVTPSQIRRDRRRADERMQAKCNSLPRDNLAKSENIEIDLVQGSNMDKVLPHVVCE